MKQKRQEEWLTLIAIECNSVWRSNLLLFLNAHSHAAQFPYN